MRALITGAASGIGRATAELFFHEGARLCLLDIREELLRDAADALEGQVQILTTDLRFSDQIEKAFAHVAAAMGGLDVFINNAGISEKAPFLEVQPEDWDRVMAVNLDGAFFAAREAARLMASNHRGSIVNVSSISGTGGGPLQSVYGTSKGGILGLTRQMAAELGPLGVRVNAVLPGAIETPMLQRTLVRDGDESRVGLNAWLQESVPLKRCGRPEEVAHVLLFLASEDASFVTGCFFPVEGGVLCV